MATRSTLRITTKNRNNISSSKSQKTVFLHDWWLTKAENDFNGKRLLAVAGLKSRRKTATQIFSSAPILKRCNTFYLETADGLTVFIHGNINKTRTHESGISSEVCNHFQNGFPYNWEDFSYHCGEGSISTNIFGRLNECGNLKGGASEWSSSEDKSEDSAVDSVSQMSAEDSVEQKSSHDNKLVTSQTKTRRRLEYTTDVSSTPITKDREKNLLFLPPEESNCKRSRSGRLIVPPLDYWRNQQVLYDMDRRIVGVLNGLPVAEYPTGSKSKSSRKKKFV